MRCMSQSTVRRQPSTQLQALRAVSGPQTSRLGAALRRRARRGFVKLFRLRRSSGKQMPLPSPPYPGDGPFRTRHCGPTREALPHPCAVLRGGQQMPP